MKWTQATLLVVMVAFVPSGCDLVEVSPAPAIEDPAVSGKGSLFLTINDALAGARTLVPPIVMEMASLDIRGVGPDPGSDTFEYLGNTSGVLALNDLAPGAWRISVEARNPYLEGDPNRKGEVIGYGETDPPVRIAAGSVTWAAIVITPLPGSGIFSLSISGTRNAFRTVQAQGTLTPGGGGTPISMGLVPTSQGNLTTFAYSNESLPAGYYIMSVELRSGGSLLWGITEAVRIIQGQTTSQAYTLN